MEKLLKTLQDEFEKAKGDPKKEAAFGKALADTFGDGPAIIILGKLAGIT